MGKESFNHPYEPYGIQLELMQCIYDTLSLGKKLAILESPTGTGKTLSLICSVVTWLRQNKADLVASGGHNVGGLSGSESDDDEPDWVNDAFKTSVLDAKMQKLREYEVYLGQLGVGSKPTSLEAANEPRKRRKRVEVSLDESDFLPQAYVSDSEEKDELVGERNRSLLAQEVSGLLAKLDHSKGSERDPIESQNPVKIYYASRTHSQLNQFASQLRLPSFPSSFADQQVPAERLKYVPLASRKQLCINENVKKWKTVDAINDACADLLKSKKGCPYHQPSSTSSNLFRDHTFTQVQDIEELAELGRSLHICPYYATRGSLENAEIITLPYQYLLSESTRTSLGINLKDSIVVIDEAHNLIETINSIHSAQIALTDLLSCNEGLRKYFERFRNRLNPGNRVNLMKLMELCNTLARYIKINYKKPGQEISSSDIFGSSNMDTLNIHKLNKYIKKSKIASKIDTYIHSFEDEKNASEVKSSSTPLLFKVASFLSCLSNPAQEGRFFFEKGQVIKYMLLEPGKSFQSVLEDARCVILAGGTMQPISDLMENLFAGVPEEKISILSCDHVIPDANLRTYITQEPAFEFTFEKRQAPSLVNGALYNFFDKLSRSVPRSGGIVGFFPSYQYLDYVVDSWQREGLFDKLDHVRKIYFESKNGAEPLSAYSEAVAGGKGALLFAVVGGKLSEGINFQDDLCRAVVIAGLPFPNVFSGELLIKTRHLETKILRNGGSNHDAKNAAREFYETICMKAVNQSIGRAIRHANDYSLIFLLDKRYAKLEINSKLSKWVSKRLQPQSSVTDIMADTQRFFSLHSARQSGR
ncbi:DNA helicase TDEL_0C01100 [Torulaspora delbrueckii]|uniref:ATP-dependent DNA helicase CHL1 n=1 Tax=Torulaspora delbrueckii TaxID=4950 RepID=G8ZR57_TORDE|nr:hypothetical protein TDEL_0C01100 [Torulaspora delbrueckii]CCE90999.1 hypothetical protein TDEL_0C01100 [Torulaspora delbrueckii]